MRIDLQQKSRFFIYFLVGIALPCLLLGYFAIRGIQNDRALYEQQLLDKNQKIARHIVETIDHQFTKIEQSIVSGLHSTAKPELIDSSGTLKKNHPQIEELFYFDRGNMKLLTAHLLFTSRSDFKFSTAPGKSLSSPAYTAGLQSEFQQRSFENAIANYQQAYNQTHNQQSKAEVLNALARAQKKASRFNDALNSYQKLNHEYGKLISAGGIPLGLAAQMESGFICSLKHDTLSAIQVYLNAFNELYRGLWSLEKSQYDFWSRALRDSLEKIFSRVKLASPVSSYLHTFKRIEARENIQLKVTDRLLKFQTEVGKTILERASSQSTLSRRFTLSINNQEYFISLLNQAENQIDDEKKYVGILWQIDIIKDSLAAIIIKKNLVNSNIAWRVADKDNQSVFNTIESIADKSKFQLKTAFVNNFPEWTLELYHQNPTLIESLLASRRSIYFYIFMLIAGILIFGSILTIRSVSRELELAKMKSDFVSSITHELKSPLTSIRQLAEMLQRGRVPSGVRRQKYYDVIVEQSERLSLLINNVLDFAKMEAGKKQFNFELTDMSHFLTEIISVMQQEVSHDEFEVKLELAPSLPSISIDRSAISQAIHNLFDNAIKYSDRVKKVLIQSYVEDQFLLISVTDFGIGIKSEDMEKIFERFCRGDDVFVRSKRGSGLGLTLVKQIVRAHRGSVEVKSEYGKGSTFTIKLPIRGF